MATYKKRGFKNKASSNKAEALENKSTTANVFNTLDEGSSGLNNGLKKIKTNSWCCRYCINPGYWYFRLF